jgi:hypothetical protein
MRVITELEMWRSGALVCVLILHEDPDGLIVQVRRQQDVVVSVWCSDPDAAAAEAEHWYGKFVGTTDDHQTSPLFDSREKLRDHLKHRR